MMRVLVAGAGGMLAQDLIPRLRQREHQVVSPAEDAFDITDESVVLQVTRAAEPDLVINCAAYNLVDKAESDMASAEAVNGYGVRNLCIACRDVDVPLVHFSTDYVFGGSNSRPYKVGDATGPITCYGRSKLMGENFVRELMPRYYLLRTSWLFGLHGPNFVEAILAKARRDGRLSVVDDETGCPTWTAHLADAVVELLDTGRFGLYHATNSGATTWYDFAVEILRLSNIEAEVSRTTTLALGRAARRPRYSVLDSGPLPEVLGREMPTWSEALAEYLALRTASAKA